MQNVASYGQLVTQKTQGHCANIVERINMEELIAEMENIIADVNVEEIAAHINEESLWNWCGAWRERANELMGEIKKHATEFNTKR